MADKKHIEHLMESILEISDEEFAVEQKDKNAKKLNSSPSQKKTN